MECERWEDLVEAIERPASILAGAAGAERTEALVDALSANGLFPLAYHAWQTAGVLKELPPEQRERLRERTIRYLAGWLVAWEEIGGVLDRWLAAGLTPVLLKGADLALRYYPEPHLRPISDLDVLFPSTAESERAFALLESAGFRPEEGLQDHWSLAQHLPALRAPVTGLMVEIHGALLVSPRDSRWTGGGVRLIEDRRPYTWQGRRVEGLAPEAQVAYLCGHMWLQHAGEPPRAMVLYDLKMILEKEESVFRWPRLVDLAGAAGAAGAVLQGFGSLESCLGLDLPPEVRSALEACGQEPELSLSPSGAAVEQLVGRLRHEGWLGALKAAWRIAFPSVSYMRWRYPVKEKWPAVALYGYRWVGQAGRMALWVLERLRLGLSKRMRGE